MERHRVVILARKSGVSQGQATEAVNHVLGAGAPERDKKLFLTGELTLRLNHFEEVYLGKFLLVKRLPPKKT